MDGELLAGKIVNTHGIHGEVKALYETDDAGFFHTIRHITLRPLGKTFCLAGARAHKGAVLLRLEGIASIEQAEALVGQELYVAREEASLPAGRYFIADIVGMRVITEEGALLGEVEDVFSTGSNDVFEVKTSAKKRIYIPHITDVVKNISLENRTVTIHVMEGLLDDDH